MQHGKLIIAISATATLALLAGAQQSSNSSRQNTQSANQSSQGEQSPLDWESTTIVGYDFNNDGRVDAYYATTRYELEQMKRRAGDYQRQNRNQSANRNDQWSSNSQYDSRNQFDSNRSRSNQYDNRMYDNNTSMNRNSQYQQGSGDQYQRSQPMMDSPKTFDGTIKSLRNFNLTGLGEARTIARVETDTGDRVAVILDSKSRMQNIDLGPGDDVKFRVHKGAVNNRQVLIADRIRVNGRTYEIQQKEADRVKRINGTIVDTMTRELRNRNGQKVDHLMIKVQNGNGRTCVVSLGPESKRDASRLSQGERVSILAAPTTVNGRQIYTARTIHHDGQTKQLATSSRDTRSGSQSEVTNRSNRQGSGG